MNERMFAGVSFLLKIAIKQLNLAQGRALLANSIGRTVDDYISKAKHSDPELKEQLEGGLLTLLLELEPFMIKDNIRYPSVSLKDPFKITIFQNKTDVSEDSDPDVGRANTTLGKYINRFYAKSLDEENSEKFKKFFTDKFLDNFVKEVNLKNIEGIDILDSSVDDLGASGDDLTEAYEDSAAKSCMSGGDCGKMSLLANNPDKVRLVSMLGNKARALLWTCDDGTMVLDRIYPSGSKYILPMVSWAKSKGYVVRSNPDRIILSSHNVKLSDGEEHKVTLNVGKIRMFPYLDTFKFGDFSKDLETLTLSNNTNFGEAIFDEANGSFEGASIYGIEIQDTKCSDCGEFFNPDESGGSNPNGDSICESCAERYSYCEQCNNIVNSENMYSLGDEYMCERCFEDNATKCWDCDKYFDMDTESGGYDENGEAYCPKCLKDNEQCENCSNVIIEDKKIYDEDGDSENYCGECYERFETGEVCEKCKHEISYDPVNGLCRGCIPEFETGQRVLPFGEEEENLNEALNEASINIINLYKLSNYL